MSSATPQKELKPIVPEYTKKYSFERLFIKYLKNEAIDTFNTIPGKIYRYIFNTYHLLFNNDDIDDQGDKKYYYIPSHSNFSLSVEELLKKAIFRINELFYIRSTDMDDDERKELKVKVRELLGHYHYVLHELSEEQLKRSRKGITKSTEKNDEKSDVSDDSDEDEVTTKQERRVTRSQTSTSTSSSATTTTPKRKTVAIDEDDRVTISKEEFLKLKAEKKEDVDPSIWIPLTPTKPCNCKSSNCGSNRCGCRANGSGCNVNCACASSSCLSPFKPSHKNGSLSEEKYKEFAQQKMNEMTNKMNEMTKQMKALQH
jgi:hypothetical protein